MKAARRARRLLLAALLLGSACRFERRPDLAANEPVDSTLYRAGAGSLGPVEDSVLATIVAVTHAFGLGDVARVAQLTTRDAVLIDQEDEIHWTRADAAVRLPRPLRGAEDGLGWQLDRATFSLLSAGSALASLRLHASVAGESVPWTAVESWVLVREGDGWRVRYLHRSRGLGREGRP